MNKNIVYLLSLGLLLSGCSVQGTEDTAKSRDILFQVNLLQSLTAGDYDGTITVGELKKHGDTGIGTFEGVNGELIAIDGTIYQALDDGSVVIADSEQTVPFATITDMDNDIQQNIFESEDISDLKNELDVLVNENGINQFYMVKLDGKCENILVRSELKQEKPYKPLDEVLAVDQREFSYSNCEGTIIGLYCPPYMNGLNTPGWHFHFLSTDKKTGGHILSVDHFAGSLSMDKISEFELNCEDTEEFNNLDLSIDQSERIKEVEQGK